MRHLRLLIITLATICALAFGVFALVNRPAPFGGDDIIIKGGSLEIQCGSNHGSDCLGTPDTTGKYKHKKDKSHILQVVVKDKTGTVLYSSAFDKDHQPEIDITYK